MAGKSTAKPAGKAKSGDLAVLVRSGLADGSFSPYFQPKFDPETEDVVAIEALLRWDHPSEGFREAAWFMPKVERSKDLLVEIDTWVLSAVMRQGRAWLDNDYDFGFLSINISSWDAGDALLKMVMHAIDESGFPATRLALECPWRILAADKGGAVSKTMRSLSALGCHIVLDGNPLDGDSLAVARETPAQWSKVCAEYIEEAGGHDGAVGLKNAVKQWHRRGVQVIAVGVEDDAQVALAQAAGCQYVQGHRFKMALPADDVDYLLKAFRDTKKALSLF